MSYLTTLFNYVTGRFNSSVASFSQKTLAVDNVMLHSPAPVWSKRNYHQFAEEAYIKNVIAHRSIKLVAESAASVPWKVKYKTLNSKVVARGKVIERLLAHPHPTMGASEFFTGVYTERFLSGNAYLHVVVHQGEPQEIHALRPDKVTVIAGSHGWPVGYHYQAGNVMVEYPAAEVDGFLPILHLRYYHPLSEWYGLSPVEAAAYSIDQHNQAAIWNQSLLQNGARPSGALILKPSANHSAHLTDEQFSRLRSQVDELFAGSKNAGRPLVLEGGMEWREMSLSNKDMDFIEAKNSAAREIALAFGVPPQLLGIPGDSTYSNMQEARLALWEETVLPLLDMMKSALNRWLLPHGNEEMVIEYDRDAISALAPRREAIWQRLEQVSFMTINEKREAVGLPPLKEKGE